MSLIASSKRLIIGAGPTGQAVARHFQELGIQFEIADTRQSDALNQDFSAQFPDVATYFGPLKADYLDRFEEIVKTSLDDLTITPRGYTRATFASRSHDDVWQLVDAQLRRLADAGHQVF